MSWADGLFVLPLTLVGAMYASGIIWALIRRSKVADHLVYRLSQKYLGRPVNSRIYKFLTDGEPFITDAVS